MLLYALIQQVCANIIGKMHGIFSYGARGKSNSMVTILITLFGKNIIDIHGSAKVKKYKVMKGLKE